MALWIQSRPEGSHRVRIQLHPPHLGSLEVQLTLHDQQVHATVTTTTDVARDLLLAAQGDLQASLASRGFHLAGLEVQVGKPRDEGRSSFGDFSGDGRDGWSEEETIQGRVRFLPPGGWSFRPRISVFV